MNDFGENFGEFVLELGKNSEDNPKNSTAIFHFVGIFELILQLFGEQKREKLLNEAFPLINFISLMLKRLWVV